MEQVKDTPSILNVPCALERHTNILIVRGAHERHTSTCILNVHGAHERHMLFWTRHV